MEEMSSPSTNNAAYFELMPGKALDIQFSHPVNLRIKTSLIGYEVGKYIILKQTPNMRGRNYSMSAN